MTPSNRIWWPLDVFWDERPTVKLRVFLLVYGVAMVTLSVTKIILKNLTNHSAFVCNIFIASTEKSGTTNSSQNVNSSKACSALKPRSNGNRICVISRWNVPPFNELTDDHAIRSIVILNHPLLLRKTFVCILNSASKSNYMRISTNYSTVLFSFFVHHSNRFSGQKY